MTAFTASLLMSNCQIENGDNEKKISGFTKQKTITLGMKIGC